MNNKTIYTLGCSITNWHWPTWSDWLSMYSDCPVINLASPGYGNHLIYNIILEKIKTITKDDTVMIMWANTDRLSEWYDEEWIQKNDCLEFFPKPYGKLWFNKNNSYTGLYRTHPEYNRSLSHMIIDNFRIIHNTQMLLDKIGCKYQMMMVQNPWVDSRPEYKPAFKTNWNNRTVLSNDDVTRAKKILDIIPVKNTIDLIDWSKFVITPDLTELSSFDGLWEYSFGSKEFVLAQHNTDHHPNTLVHHDFLVEKILKQPLNTSKYRSLAKSIAESSVDMEIPSWQNDDFLGSTDKHLLSSDIKNTLAKGKYEV